MALSDNQYFGLLATDIVAGELMARTKAYYDWCWRDGRLDVWRKSLAQYNVTRLTGGHILELGQQGEYLRLDVNHYCSIITNLLSLITAQKIAWDPKASNSDFKSQAQTVLAKNLLDYYVREKRLDADLTRACEFSLLYGEAGVCIEWDPLGGDIHAMEPPMEEGGEPSPVYTGDILSSVFSPIDIIRNPRSRQRFENLPWIIVRKFRSKFELANKFQEYADEIVEMSYSKDWGNHDYLEARSAHDADITEYNDEIPLYVFYHRKSSLLPEGRMVEFLSDQIVLTDSPLPYADIPLKWISYRAEDESPFGYSNMWDLLPLQKAVSSIHSTTATNHKHFGLNLLVVPRGQGWDISKSANGLSVIEIDPVLPGSAAPNTLNLLGSHGEAINYASSLVHDMETLSGINSVARGNPEASLKSGSALALVQSMAVQFSQLPQKSYYRLAEDVGTAIISNLKAFADVPRVAEISGKSKRGIIQEFQSSDLESVNRVLVEAASPMSKTLAGRVNLAELLLQQGVLKTPDDLLQVLETGNLESTLEGDMSKILLIKSENEALEDGSYPVTALITDQHLEHIHEHSACVSSPSSRQDSELVGRVTEHILEHIRILMDPENSMLLTALGQQPMAPAAPTASPAASSLGEAVDASDPLVAAGQDAAMPNMPKNAMTGELSGDLPI